MWVIKEDKLAALYKLLRLFLSKSARFSSEPLDDPELVAILFELLAIQANLQLDFLEKAHTDYVARMIDLDVISEEALVYLASVSGKRKKWLLQLAPLLEPDGLWWLIESLKKAQLIERFRLEDLVFVKQKKEGVELLAGLSKGPLRERFQQQLFDSNCSVAVFMRTHLQWRVMDSDANSQLLFLFENHLEANQTKAIETQADFLFSLKRLVTVFYPRSLPNDFDMFKTNFIVPLKDYVLMKTTKEDLKDLLSAIPTYLMEAVVEAALEGHIPTLKKGMLEQFIRELPKLKKSARRKKWDVKQPKPVVLPEILKERLEHLKFEMTDSKRID